MAKLKSKKLRPDGVFVDRQIGARIRLMRVDRGYSQERLGKALGLTFQQVQKYEKGANSVAAARIPRLLRVLRMEANDLFADIGHEDDHATQATETVPSTSALDLALRFEKLGPRGRKAMEGVLAFVEGIMRRS